MVPRRCSEMGSGGGVGLFEILVSSGPVVLLLGWILVNCFFAANLNGGGWWSTSMWDFGCGGCWWR